MTPPDEPSAEVSEPVARKLPWLRRSRWRTIIFRIIAWSFIGAVLLVAGVYGGLKIYLTPTRLKELLIQQAAAQTGGQLAIGAVEFDLLRGVWLTDVAYTPPKVGDDRGLLEGGALEPKALLRLGKLRIEYSVRKFLAARAEIGALQLVVPDLYLKQTDGVFNFAGIMAYRDKHFPKAKELAGPPAPEPPKKPGKGLLPLDPSLIYLPFHLLVQNVGFQDLRVHLEKEDKGVLTQVLKTSGLSLDLGTTWFGNQSRIWLDLDSSFERPFTLTIDAPGKEAAKLARSLTVRSALGFRFDLNNLTKVKMEIAARLAELATPAAGYRDLGAYVKVAAALTDDLKGVQIDTVDIDVADALTYQLGGLVSVADSRMQQITLKLKQELNIDLKQAALLAKPFMPTLQASGEIALENFKIDGLVEPEKFKQAAKDLIIPYVSGTLWLHEVYVDLPATGVSMAPVIGSLSVAAGPALTGGGSQVDVALDLQLPRIGAAKATPVGKVAAEVDGLIAKVTARALWPQMVAPILKVNIEASHVKATGQRIAPVDVPLFVDIDAEGRQDLERLGLNANVELTGLAELSAMADCQASCTHFRSSLQARLNSLAKLHAMALPLSDQLHLGEAMPSRLSGAVEVQAACRGMMPNPRTTPTKDLVEQADIQFSTQLNISKLNAKLPLDQIDLKGFETRFLLAGSLHDQKLDFTQKVDSLALVLPPPKPSAPGGDAKPSAAPLADAKVTSAAPLVDGKTPSAAPPADDKTPNAAAKDDKTPNAAAKDDKAPADGGALQAAPAATKPPQPVALEHLAFDLSIDNAIDGAVDISQIPALLRRIITKVDTKLFIGKVAMDGVLPRPVADLQLNGRVSQEHMSNVSLQDFAVRLPDYGTTVTVAAEAGIGANYQPQRVHAKLDTQVVHNGDEKLPGGIKTSGRMGIKIAVDSDDMRTVAVDGDATFNQFNVTIPGKDEAAPPTLVVEKISGQIPFKQLVKLPEPKPTPAPGAPALAAANGTGTTAPTAAPTANDVGPNLPDVIVVPDGEEPVDSGAVAMNQAVQGYLNKNDSKPLAGSNLVATVDYGTIRPFYPERRPLSIQRLEAANLEFSKMEFDLELRQNWFALNQFVISFLGGKIEGDFQLAFDASNPVPSEVPQNLRASVHLTRLDSRKLIERFPNLSGKASSSELFSNPYIDATLHLIFDMRSSDISGGLDISSIGKEQLRMILYFVDPYEQNPTIADIRKALAFGEVRQVAIPLKNGEVGMDVDLRILGAPIPLPKLTHFPISQLLQNVKEQSPPAAAGAG